MTFNWISCKDCNRKYLDKEKHYVNYHSEEKRDVKEDIPSIPFMYNDRVRKLLKRSKLQVIRQKPELLVKVAPFIHQPIEDGDLKIDIDKIYKVEMK